MLGNDIGLEQLVRVSSHSTTPQGRRGWRWQCDGGTNDGRAGGAKYGCGEGKGRVAVDGCNVSGWMDGCKREAVWAAGMVERGWDRPQAGRPLEGSGLGANHGGRSRG